MKNLKRFTQIFTFFFFTFTITNTALAQLDYSTAIGLRVGYFGDLGITAKKAIGENGAAIEGILFGDFGSGTTSISVNGLYEKHSDIGSVEGLDWYWAGGAYIGFLSFDTGLGERDSNVFLGLRGGVGLEYKFANVPIAISTDWLPGLALVGGGGFSARGGTVAVRYTLE